MARFHEGSSPRCQAAQTCGAQGEVEGRAVARAQQATLQERGSVRQEREQGQHGHHGGLTARRRAAFPSLPFLRRRDLLGDEPEEEDHDGELDQERRAHGDLAVEPTFQEP